MGIGRYVFNNENTVGRPFANLDKRKRKRKNIYLAQKEGGQPVIGLTLQPRHWLYCLPCQQTIVCTTK